MGLFGGRKGGFIAAAKSFNYRNTAREYFGEKYGFVGEQLQKLCADTGLMNVSAEIDTGEWFVESYSGGEYFRYKSVKIYATPEQWKVVIPE